MVKVMEISIYLDEYMIYENERLEEESRSSPC